MARSRTSKFDASEVITNELIRIIERGVLPWRKPWTAGASASVHCATTASPIRASTASCLTMRTVMAGHTSPFWMTVPQANAQGARIRKGETLLCGSLLWPEADAVATMSEDTNGADSRDVSPRFSLPEVLPRAQCGSDRGADRGDTTRMPAPVPDHPPHCANPAYAGRSSMPSTSRRSLRGTGARLQSAQRSTRCSCRSIERF